jgi:hypothetical protein
MGNQIWKPIEGYEEDYLISNDGVVKSIKKFMKKSSVDYLKPMLNNWGYYKVNLRQGKHKRKNASIHRLVAESFIPNNKNKPCVNHIDGNKLNNHVSNLEWCTVLENSQHAWANNLHENTRKAKRIGILVFDSLCGIYYESSKEAWLSSNKKWGHSHFKDVILMKKINQTKYII